MAIGSPDLSGSVPCSVYAVSGEVLKLRFFEIVFREMGSGAMF
jgi:hypothetical protein